MAITFSVELPCKPNVKVFIEQNYGSPVRFNKDKTLMALIRTLLEKNDSRLNWRPINRSIFSETVIFYISDYDFRQYGGYLSHQAIMDLNRLFDSRVKALMRSWCSTQYAFGKSKFESIRAFQDKFGFSEDVWSFETIKKDCQRNNVFVNETKKLIESEFHKIIIAQMSRFGDINDPSQIAQ